MKVYVTEVLLSIRPNGNFVVRDNDFDRIEYLDDDCEKVSLEEYKKAEKAYTKKMQENELAKAAQRQEILDRIGLTADEVKLLLG